MKKIVYVFEFNYKHGDAFQSCFSFDLKETQNGTDMQLAHATLKDRMAADFYIAGYNLDVEEGETAKQAYNRACLECFEIGDPVFVQDTGYPFDIYRPTT